MEPVATSSDEDELIRRLTGWAAEGADTSLAGVAGLLLLEHAEGLLGFPLHPLLRRVYEEIADGGFGPGFGLLPLFHVGNGAVDGYPARVRTRSGGRAWWPREVVPVVHWGAGRFAAVDCRSINGTVLQYAPGSWAAGDTWFVEADYLADWLEEWMVGTRWHQHRKAERDRVRTTVLWDEIDARLSEAGNG